MEFDPRKKVAIHLNVTPLIDIIFLLLIFFMLTANFIMQPGIDVRLPKADNVKLQDNEQIVVTVSKAGKIFINEKEIKEKEVEAAVKKAFAGSSKKSVILRADSDLKFGPVVKVMDAIKKADAEGIIISTQKGADR